MSAETRRGAVLRALCCVGMGHNYLGRVAVAWVLLAIAVAALGGVAVSWTHAGWGAPTVAVVGAAVALWIGQTIWVARIARTAEPPLGHRVVYSTAFFVGAAIVLTFVVARVIVVPFFVEGFHVPQAGMSPTLLPGDRFFSAKLGASPRDPARGDVVVFEDHPKAGYTTVQRVVALAGDRVEIDEQGRLAINDKPLERRPCGQSEPPGCFVETAPHGRSYHVLLEPEAAREPILLQSVPDGHVFVLGDNRDASADSRTFGPVPVARIEAVAKRIWWSDDRSRIGNAL